LKKSDNIFEIGCSGGSNFRTFSKLGLINGKYFAIDISSKAVENLFLSRNRIITGKFEGT